MKYNNKKIIVDDICFDSKKEAKRYRELKLLEQAGVISDLRMQVKYILIPEQREETKEVYRKGPNKGKLKKGSLLERECSYLADFTYYDVESQQLVVEDTKGMRTHEYIIKRKLMLKVYGIRIHEV